MDQIIGGYKEFIVIDRITIRDLQQQADELEFSDEEFSTLRALEIRRVIDFIKARNIYNNDFKIKR
jgi:hypothetical protein